MPRSFTSCDPGSQPDRPTSPPLFQGLGAFDFFNNLLFNRERIYQGVQTFSSIRTGIVKREDPLECPSIARKDPISCSIEVKQEETMAPKCSTSISQTAATLKLASKPSRKSTRKISTKAVYKDETNAAVAKKRKPTRKTSVQPGHKGEFSATVARKRKPPSPDESERASKKQKTTPQANSGKRVNGRGKSVHDAFVISDDEHGSGKSRQNSGTDDRTTAHPCSANTLDSADDLEPVLTAFSAPTNVIALRVDSSRLQNVHVKETHQLQPCSLLQQACEPNVQDVVVSRHQSIAYDKALAALNDELEAERQHSADLTWECDHLRREADAVRRSLKGEIELTQEKRELKRVYEEALAANADLMRNLAAKEEKAACEAADTKQETQRLSQQNQDLQQELTKLKDEKAALKALVTQASTEPKTLSSLTGAPIPRSPPHLFTNSGSSSTWTSPTSSPSTRSLPPNPLTSPSTPTHYPQPDDQRLLNLRRTYITTKKRYDNLHSIASHLVIVTKSWDVDFLGDVGFYLKGLRRCVGDSSEGKGELDGEKTGDEVGVRIKQDGAEDEDGNGVAKVE